MVRSIGAQLGLLAFGIAVLAGLHAGNSVTTVLVRALLAMLAGLVLGQAVSWTGKLIVRDHLQRKKLAIDREHRDMVRALSGAPPAAPDSAAPGKGG